MCAYLLSIGLQTKAVRQKSQHQSLNPSHTNLFSSVGSATIKEQAIRPSIYGNVFADKEEAGMVRPLAPIAYTKREQKGTSPAFQQMSNTSLHDNTSSSEEDKNID